MRPRRLLFYTHALVGGGAERVWAVLASAFHRRGHAVTFAVDFEDPANRPYLDPAIPTVVLGRNHARATLALRRHIVLTRPEAAFAAVGASDLKLLAASAFVRRGPRLVLSVHGGIEYETGLLGNLRFRAIPVTSRIMSRTITVSHAMREDLVTRWHASPTRLMTLYNPVVLPPRAQVPSAAELAARPDDLIALGRLIPQKDIVTMIRALARSQRARRLIVLGDGPERAHLEAFAASLGLAERVEFRGYLPEPWEAFAEAKAFVHAARSEAFGNVVVEALGHGLPAVSSAAAGPSEILGFGRYGRLFEPGDPVAMSEAIDAALADPGDPAAHRRRAEDFSVDAVTDRYETLVEDILAVPPRLRAEAPA